MMEFQTERQIGDYTVTLPSPPSDIKKILNYGLPAKQQKFPVIRPPKDFWSWESDKKNEFIKLQWQYRKSGMHFYNNGNIEYVTGDHWFYLTHWHLDTGLPKFIDADRDFFYLVQFSDNNPKSFGLLDIENRRGGKTWRSTCKLYNKISQTTNANGGIQSKTNEDARTVFDKMVYGWRKMVDFFKPVDIGIFPPKSELVFDTPIKKSTKVKLTDTKGVLNSKIDFSNVKSEAYDGTKLIYYYNDEFGKNTEADVVETQKIVRECCMEEGRIRGKQLWTTTVEEMENKGGNNAKILWDNSAPFADKTMPFISKTGLIRYFKPCYYGYLGADDLTGKSFIDEWGYSDIELAKKYFERRRKMYADDIQAYRGEVQKYPFTIEEAFYVVNNGSVLNLFNIADQLAFNESSPVPLTSVGDLEWVDGVIDSDDGVKFVPNPNGRFTFAKHPAIPNQYVVKGNNIYPANGTDGSNGVIGIDPISAVKSFSKRQSDLAAVGFEFFRMNDDFSDIPVFEYCNRVTTTYEMFEDMIKVCVYYGFPAHIERNKEGLIAHFQNRGYENYLVKRPSFSISQYSENRNDDGAGTPNSSEAFRNMLVSALKDYIETRCGFQKMVNDRGDEIRVMSKFYLNGILKSLQDFVPSEKWTPYDLPVAFMYALIMRHQYIAPKIEKKPVKINFVRYNIVGNRSVVSK